MTLLKEHPDDSSSIDTPMSIEHALGESEERFRAVVETASDAIILADHLGTIMSWNKAAQALFGYSEDEARGMSLTMIMPARYRESHQKGLERVRMTGHTHLMGKTIELHGLRKDGSEFPLELSLACWKTKQGMFHGGIIRDITERKHAQEALRESEERFRQVTENINEVFWMTNPEKTQMLYVSPGYEKIWGSSCNSLYASPTSWLNAIHPEDRDRVSEAALTKQVLGEYDEEYRIIRPDASIRWIQDRAFPIRDQSGKVYRIAGIASCITERKLAQAALHKAHDKLETILASLPGAIFIVDERQQIVYANPLADQYFGSEDARPVGHPLFNVLPFNHHDWARLTDELNAHDTNSNGSNGRQPEGEFETNKHTYRYRLFHVVLRENHLQQIGIFLWDVTQQKQLTDQLIQAEKLASLGIMVSGMAHEINNPAQGILGMAQLILEESDPLLIKEYALDIVNSVGHVATVVKDFASYVRPAPTDVEVELDVSDRMTKALNLVRRGPHFSRVEVITDFHPIPPIRARRTEIDQIFVNLISNAVQAMKGDGYLTLATRLKGESVIASVTDTGCGIPKDHLSKIFDPFFTTKEPGVGTGIGLYITYTIASRYGGTLEVDSEVGEGTTIRVVFPVHHPSPREVSHGYCCT